MWSNAHVSKIAFLELKLVLTSKQAFKFVIFNENDRNLVFIKENC